MSALNFHGQTANSAHPEQTAKEQFDLGINCLFRHVCLNVNSYLVQETINELVWFFAFNISLKTPFMHGKQCRPRGQTFLF